MKPQLSEKNKLSDEPMVPERSLYDAILISVHNNHGMYGHATWRLVVNIQMRLDCCIPTPQEKKIKRE